MFHISAAIMLAIAGVPESTCAPASGSPLVSPVAASVVPFEARQDAQIVVPLYLDGTGPWRFLVDTGASRSAISEAVALQIGMPIVSQGEVRARGGGGTDTRAVVRLTNLTVGCARAQALLAPTLSQREVKQLGTDVVGVLGQDFLSRFSYTLDYRGSLLTWEFGDAARDEAAAREDRRVVRLPLRETDEGFVVDVAGTRFVPASTVPATRGIVLLPGARTNQLLADSAAQSGELVAIANRRAARLVVLKRLQIGGVSLWDVPGIVLLNGTTVVPEADAGNAGNASNADNDGEGLLPLSLFARVTFRPHLGYLEVEPR